MSRLSFNVVWFDDVANLSKEFLLFVYFDEKSETQKDVEIYDVKNKRAFLKKTEYQINGDLVINAKITIFARQFKIVSYADKHTEEKVQTKKRICTVNVSPKDYAKFGEILSPYFEHMNLMELKMYPIEGDVGIYGIFAGNEENFKAVNAQLANHQEKIPSDGSTAVLNNSACLIIRPHAIKNSGKILQKLLDAGFEISALKSFALKKSEADEFLEVYKGVLPEQPMQADELSAGICLVAEIRQENVIQKLKDICGPHDPELAKHLRPNTIRAIFGENRIKNAVHCTDLDEDGILEVEYFFKILI
jgi:nucleoside-diphosphate kinase